MAPNYGKCAGCKGVIKSKEFVVCSICDLKYDIDCAQISSKRFQSFYALDQERKRNWKCESCVKTHKTSPIRPLLRTDQTPGSENTCFQPDNITTRKRTNSNDKLLSHSINNAPNCSKNDEYNEDRLRHIIKEEIQLAMKTVVKELVTDQLKNINSIVESFQESMLFINKQYEDLKGSMEQKNNLITKLESDNEHLYKSVHDLTARLSQVEQHMRECNIEINGVPEHNSENLANTVVQLARTIECQITDSEIQHVSRVAKFNKESNRPRAIIVKLRNHRQRDTLLAAVYKFNKNKTHQDKLNSKHLGIGGDARPVFVAEHLTPANKQLHAATRIKAKELLYKFVWVRDGRIYVRKDETNPAKLIRNMDDLRHIT